MLKKETIKQVAAFLKIKEADLDAALKDEKEVDLTFDTNLQTFTPDEVSTLKTNEYNSGKVKGVEMAVKEAKDKLGLEFTGKTIDGLVTAAQKKAVDDAKVEPDKKVQELNEKLTTVQNSYKQLEIQFKEKEGEIETGFIKGEVFKHIPDLGEGAGFDKDDVYAKMYREGYEFKKENGKVVAYKGGKQVLDKVSNAEDVKNVVNSFMTEKKLITGQQQPSGRGGANGAPTTKYATLSELKKSFTDQNKSHNGQEFYAAVQKAVAENKEFQMDK